MRVNDPAELLAQALQSLYNAENQLLLALPRVAARAHGAPLRNMLETHLEQTRGHAERLEQAADLLGVSCTGRRSFAMEGILREGDEMMGNGGDPALVDAAIVSACRAVEQYEIAAYTSARHLATALGRPEVVRLLEATLAEEGQASETLTRFAAESTGAQAPAAGAP